MESWVGVSGYENRYAISDQGRVWSYKNQIFLKPGVSSNGYHTVSLWHPNHPRKSWLVQELVLSSFVRARTPGDVCRHLDGSKLNNVLGNLAWGTPAENRADADRHGTSVRGEQYCSAKLTGKAARDIRRLKGVVSQSALAARFGVSASAVQAVHDGRTWTHA